MDLFWRFPPDANMLKAALMMQAGLAAEFHDRENMIAFAANQRDEVRDLHDIAGALGAQPNGAPARAQRSGSRGERSRSEMSELPPKGESEGYGACGDAKQQTFVTQECLTPWDTQQQRIFLPDGVAPTMAGADGGGGRNPAGLLFAAGFCAGAGAKAGGIGCSAECAPTLKASASGNMMPSVLCLNDQGGSMMECSKDVSGTLRAQEHGHQPLVLASQQGGAEIGVGLCPTITSAAGTSGNNQPVLFEGHGHDLRYKQMEVAPTLSSAAGMGGGNIPLIGKDQPVLFENHGIDSRYTGPHPVAPTMSARYGTGFSEPCNYDNDLHD